MMIHYHELVLQWIVHDWADEECLRLLKSCHKAVPENGKVIVMDVVLPVGTREELLALAPGAGFASIRFGCLVCNFWVMEFFK